MDYSVHPEKSVIFNKIINENTSLFGTFVKATFAQSFAQTKFHHNFWIASCFRIEILEIPGDLVCIVTVNLHDGGKYPETEQWVVYPQQKESYRKYESCLITFPESLDVEFLHLNA